MSGEDFLSRWSRLKKTARQPEAERSAPPPVRPEPAKAAPAAAVPAEPEPLPPVESLTAESDFAPFMRSDVAPALRRQALRTLFQDARFNVMDGLDVYIDDYSKPDPIPPEWLGQLRQMARLGDYQEPKAEADASDGQGEPEATAPAADAAAAAQPDATDEMPAEAPGDAPDDARDDAQDEAPKAGTSRPG